MSIALDKAKEIKDGDSEDVVTLSRGIRMKVVPIPPGLLEDILSSIEEPEVPMWYNPDKERDEPNPMDPGYLRAKKQVDREQTVATMDTIALFGMELVDGLPDDDSWVRKLQFLEKRGRVNLDDYDLDDELDREFLYKRYIALGAKDFELVQRKVMGLSEEEIELARKQTFPDDETGDSD